MECNTLTHYGILGMKWGIRRTPAQLARARGEKVSDSGNNSKKSTSSKFSSSSTKKSISEMSDDELNKAVRRLQLEQQYRSLNPEKVSLGRRFVNKVSKDVIVPAATEVARNTLRDALTKAVTSATSKKLKK